MTRWSLTGVSTRSTSTLTTRGATPRRSTTSTIQLGDDRVADALNLLLLGLESLFIGIVRCIHPLDALLDSIHDSLLVFLGDLLTELLLVGYSVLHRVEVVLER